MQDKFERADATRAALPSLAADVAKELGEGWTYVPDPEGGRYLVDIYGPDGERLGMTVDTGKPEHIDISGWLPKEVHTSGAYTSDLKYPSISVAAARGAVTIGKEIKRRLMSAYQELLVEARKRAADSLHAQAVRDEAVDLVATLLGQRVPERGRYDGPKDDVYFNHSPQGRGYGRIRVGVGGYISIELTGGIENLQDVIAAIGKVA